MRPRRVSHGGGDLLPPRETETPTNARIAALALTLSAGAWGRSIHATGGGGILVLGSEPVASVQVARIDDDGTITLSLPGGSGALFRWFADAVAGHPQPASGRVYVPAPDRSTVEFSGASIRYLDLHPSGITVSLAARKTRHRRSPPASWPTPPPAGLWATTRFACADERREPVDGAPPALWRAGEPGSAMRADRTTELVVHQRAAKDVPRLNQRCTATSDYRTAAAGPRLATVVIEGLLATDAAVPKSAINTEPQWFTNFTLESATLSATAP